MVGERGQVRRRHLADTDDALTALECAGQTSEVVGGEAQRLDHRALLVAVAHGLPSKAAATRAMGRAASKPWTGAANTMRRTPGSQLFWTRMK